jgi:hypothetical protein
VIPACVAHPGRPPCRWYPAPDATVFGAGADVWSYRWRARRRVEPEDISLRRCFDSPDQRKVSLPHYQFVPFESKSCGLTPLLNRHRPNNIPGRRFCDKARTKAAVASSTCTYSHAEVFATRRVQYSAAGVVSWHARACGLRHPPAPPSSQEPFGRGCGICLVRRRRTAVPATPRPRTPVPTCLRLPA